MSATATDTAQTTQTEIDLVTAIRQLTSELPLNDFGLPTGIYRTDLLPFATWEDPKYRDHSTRATPALSSEETESKDPRPNRREPDALQSDVSAVADPFSLMSGEGDGLPDMIMPKREAAPLVVKNTGPYRIAGFLASDLGNAFVPLQYDEGFPAFENGQAFWNRLDYEPSDAYMAFERYLQSSFGRSVSAEDEGVAAAGTRSINSLVLQIVPRASDEQILQSAAKFKEYYHLYYWGLRTRSYDLYRVTQYRQSQELRAIETQDDHYLQSRKMRARLTEYMESDEEFWDLMTPKTAVDLHKHLTSLERISAGVPASGPMVKEPEGGGKTFEVAFRTIAQKQAGESAKGDVLTQDGDILDKALESPEAVQLLQELVIKGNS